MRCGASTIGPVPLLGRCETAMVELTSLTRQLWELRSRWMMFMECR